MQLQINEKFKKLIPPLSAEEYTSLEQSILKNGVLDPLDVWNGFIVDGHNRYEIATKHGVKFSVCERTFENEDAACLFMLDKQLSRRNLPLYVRSLLALQHEEIYAAQAKARQRKGGELKGEYKEQASADICGTLEEEQSPTPKETRQIIAEKAGVSHDTVAKVEYIEKKAKPELKKALVTNPKQTINNAYQVTYIEENAPEPIKQKLISGEMSTNEAFKAVKKEEKIAQREQQIEEIKEEIKKENLVINHKHDVVILDPPWAYGRGYDPDGSRVANPYPEMTQAEIMEKCKGFHKENSIMYLWTTHQFMFDAKELLDAWGFTYKACIVWDKEKIGMGHWFRMQCEFCLVGIKGKPLWNNTSYRDIIREPRREHSRKPEAFYNMVKEIHKDLRIFEYFSREKREGIINAGVELE